MIRCASAFLLTRLFSLINPGWLEPSSRIHLLRSLIHPYLSSLSHHLSSSFFPPLLTRPLTNGQPGTSLSPAAATAYTTLCLIQDLFPRTLGLGSEGGMRRWFPRCEELRASVEERPRIKAWIRSGKRQEEWTLRKGGELKAIREMAELYDRVEEVEEVFGMGKEGRGEKVPMEEVREEVELDTGA
ncbi:BQ2448_6137 [Microbotryum intermedium]|uniref:BQ2448_6137 protein n=1 Tax=Microbotryum intermedium TaxID=269621 RepID=A0A238FKC4_9BASI|nr:BQ2448_6137 [Microbotryum intermedium]